MEWGYVALIGTAFGVLLIIAQRIEARHKRMFRGFIVTMALILMIRYEQQSDNLVGYVIALLISFLFWLLIGRYNPVGSGDEIKVYGLDD